MAVALSMALLTVFRSVVIAVKAALMKLLPACAARRAGRGDAVGQARPAQVGEPASAPAGVH